MKVYSPPAGITPPSFEDDMDDNGRFSIDKMQQNEEAFFVQLETALRGQGYTGKRTGKLVTFPMADGKAVYMVAEGRSFALIHCPVGDAWDLPEWQTRGLTKADVIARVDAKRLFGASGPSADRY